MSSREKFWLTVTLVGFAIMHAYGASVLAGVARPASATPAFFANLGD